MVNKCVNSKCIDVCYIGRNLRSINDYWNRCNLISTGYTISFAQMSIYTCDFDKL